MAQLVEAVWCKAVIPEPGCSWDNRADCENHDNDGCLWVYNTNTCVNMNQTPAQITNHFGPMDAMTFYFAFEGNDLIGLRHTMVDYRKGKRVDSFGAMVLIDTPFWSNYYVTYPLLFGTMFQAFEGYVELYMEDELVATRPYTVDGIDCSYFTNKVQCMRAGCYWYNGECHQYPQY